MKTALSVTLFMSVALIVLVAPRMMGSGAKNCNGTLRGDYDSVEVKGGSCVLDGGTVRGSVRVNGGGSLAATGGTEIQGHVMVFRGGPIFLDDATVTGDVRVKESTSATVAKGATIGALSVERSGSIAVMGSVKSIESLESGLVSLVGASVYPGDLLVERGSARVEICSSTIAGRLNVIQSAADLLVDTTLFGSSCVPSTIDGSVTVLDGGGDVRLVGAMLNGPLEVRSAGNVTLQETTAAAGAHIAGNRGNVVIQSSQLHGDVTVDSNAAVTVAGNNFFEQQIQISNNAGPVLVDANVDLSLRVVENGEVTVRGNAFSEGEISQNNASISTIDNTHAALR